MPGNISLALLLALTLLFGTINHDGNPNICRYIQTQLYSTYMCDPHGVPDQIQHFPALYS